MKNAIKKDKDFENDDLQCFIDNRDALNQLLAGPWSVEIQLTKNDHSNLLSYKIFQTEILDITRIMIF